MLVPDLLIGFLVALAVATVGVAISLRYLLAIPIAMYAREGRPAKPVAASTSELMVIGVCALVTLYLGWRPAPGLADMLSALLR